MLPDGTQLGPNAFRAIAFANGAGGIGGMGRFN